MANKQKYLCIVEVHCDSGLLIPFVVSVITENEFLAKHSAMSKVTLNIADSHGLKSGYFAFVHENDVLQLT